MKRKNWEVTEDSIRPAGEIDKCFYCKSKIGDQHKEDCVLRKRTVVLKVSFDMVVDVPESWDKSSIEFFYNSEGSYCADNTLYMLGEQAERMGCLCYVIESEYVKEATDEDEEEFKLFVKECDS